MDKPFASPLHYTAGIDDFDTVLRVLEHEFESRPPRTEGRALALFNVIQWCVVNGHAIPWRVGHDLLIAYDIFMSLDKDTPSLNAALGLDRPSKGERGDRIMDWSSGLSTAAAVVAAVERLKATMPTDDHLFEVAAASLQRPISGSTAKGIYYEHRHSPAVLLDLQAHRERESKEAIGAAENQEAAASIRERRRLRDG